MLRSALLAAMLLAAAAPRAGAQGPVQPGSVVTLAPALEPPAGAVGAARWTFHPEPDLRSAGPTDGESDVPAAGPLLVPVGIWLPAGTPAGARTLGRLTVVWPDGSRAEQSVAVEVAARHALSVRVEGTPAPTPPGRELDLVVRLANDGNVPDTVLVRIDPADEWGTGGTRVVVEPGTEISVPLRLRVPDAARPGETRLAVVVARGAGGEDRSRAAVLVSRPEAMGGLAVLPATVFLGTSATDGELSRAVGALDARGTIGRDTELALSVRDRGIAGTSAAFRRLSGGADLRLELGRPRWRLSLGDARPDGDPLAGMAPSGRGLRLDWRTPDTHGEVYGVRPGIGGAFSDESHAWMVRAGTGLGAGEIEAAGADVRRSTGAGPGVRARTAGLRYRLPSTGGHTLSAEAGWAWLSDGRGGETAGPAAAARYAWRGERSAVSAQARGVPASVPGALMGDAVSVAASRWIAGPASVTGSARWSRGEGVAADDLRSSHRGGSLGLRLAGLRARLDLTGTLRRSAFADPDLAPLQERTLAASAWIPAGPLRLDLRGEAGTVMEGLDERGTRSLHARLPWSGRHGWLSVGGSWFSDDLHGSLLLAHVDGELRFDRIGFGGALHARRLDTGTALDGWGSVDYQVAPRTSLVLGLERDRVDGGSRDAWSVSLGFRRSLGLPLPFARRDAVSGHVFEDLDGDGHRSAGEPGVPGARVRLGALESVTDGDGRFAFPDAPGGAGRIQIDPTSVERRASVPLEVDVPERGEVEVPVRRSGVVEVRVFQDLDGDLRPGDGEPPAAARVSLIDVRGRRIDGVTDLGGRARFEGLAAGDWTIEVRVERTTLARDAATAATVQVQPHEVTVVALPLPNLVREVRF